MHIIFVLLLSLILSNPCIISTESPSKIPDSTIPCGIEDCEYATTVDEHGNHPLALLILLALESENPNMQDRMCKNIIWHVSKANISDIKKFNLLFLQNRDGEDFILTATKHGLLEKLVIPVLTMMKNALSKERFLLYLRTHVGKEKQPLLFYAPTGHGFSILDDFYQNHAPDLRKRLAAMQVRT